jgi:hypothetical protein
MFLRKYNEYIILFRRNIKFNSEKQYRAYIFNELDEAMCYPVMKNFIERIIACRASREGPLSDIVFHC